MKEFGFYSPKILVASLFLSLFVYILVPSKTYAVGKKDTAEDVSNEEILRGGHRTTPLPENVDDKGQALVTRKAPDMETAEPIKDVDKGHPLRCFQALRKSVKKNCNDFNTSL